MLPKSGKIFQICFNLHIFNSRPSHFGMKIVGNAEFVPEFLVLVIYTAVYKKPRGELLPRGMSDDYLSSWGDGLGHVNLFD